MALRPEANPLTPAHLEQINTALDKLAIAKDAITLAKRADVPLPPGQEEDVLKKEAQLLKLKQVYFPGQP